MKHDSPALAKREERQHKDLDHDGEKGEPKQHQMKVLGKAAKAPGKLIFGKKVAPAPIKKPSSKKK